MHACTARAVTSTVIVLYSLGKMIVRPRMKSKEPGTDESVSREARYKTAGAHLMSTDTAQEPGICLEPTC